MSAETDWIIGRRDHDNRSIEMIDINKLWIEKAEKLSSKVRAIARGDDDFYQEGLLGIREGLLRDPYATDSYLLQAARWAISRYRNKGVSVDSGSKREYTRILIDGTVKKYKRDILPIYIDKLISEFELEFPDYSFPPDILALDKICAEKFYRSLAKGEAELIDACLQILDGHFCDRNVIRELGIGRAKYYRIKRSAYEKFIRAFGTDEEVQILEQQKAMEEMHE